MGSVFGVTIRHIYSIIGSVRSGKKFMLSWVEGHSVTPNLKEGGPIKKHISFRLLMVLNYASWGEFLGGRRYVSSVN